MRYVLFLLCAAAFGADANLGFEWVTDTDIQNLPSRKICARWIFRFR